jgi:feruloyl esterase
MNSVNYYQSVVSRMGQKESDGFIRLYMAPGMGHCMGGTGPYSFGQFKEIQGDPEHDIEAALERWVERDVPPNKIIAAKYKEDSNPASGVVRTRPLCPYPQVAKYKGSGSTDDAANFICAESK